MPYIPDKEKPGFNVLINALQAKVLALSAFTDRKNIIGYMRHVALRVLEETALNAAEQYQGKRGTRYWLIVDHAGVVNNIAHELV